MRTAHVRVPGYSPDLFSFRVPPHQSIHDRRLSSLCVCVFRPDCISLDVLHVIHPDELFVDVRSVRSGVVERRVQFARLVSNLKKVAVNTLSVYKMSKVRDHLAEQPSPSSSPEVNVHIVVLPAHRFLHERFLQHLTVDD